MREKIILVTGIDRARFMEICAGADQGTLENDDDTRVQTLRYEASLADGRSTILLVGTPAIATDNASRLVGLRQVAACLVTLRRAGRLVSGVIHLLPGGDHHTSSGLAGAAETGAADQAESLAWHDLRLWSRVVGRPLTRPLARYIVVPEATPHAAVGRNVQALGVVGREFPGSPVFRYAGTQSSARVVVGLMAGRPAPAAAQPVLAVELDAQGRRLADTAVGRTVAAELAVRREALAETSAEVFAHLQRECEGGRRDRLEMWMMGESLGQAEFEDAALSRLQRELDDSTLTQILDGWHSEL